MPLWGQLCHNTFTVDNTNKRVDEVHNKLKDDLQIYIKAVLYEKVTLQINLLRLLTCN